MSETDTLSKSWSSYQPSKKVLIWSIVGSVSLTILVGFTVGGWTTAGGASVLAANAARKERSNFAATICVNRFIASANAAERYEELKRTSSWERKNFIEAGGWVNIAGIEAIPDAAALCVDQLLKMKEMPQSTADATSG